MDAAVPLEARVADDEVEWDSEGFVIPSLDIEEDDQINTAEIDSAPKPSLIAPGKEESMYLGPHGVSPSQSKMKGVNEGARKQRFKQKLKELERNKKGEGRENKVAILQELVGGGGRITAKLSEGSEKDWLDSHCHESQFDRAKTR